MRAGTAEILARLLAFDTTTRNSNLEAMGWIAAYLRGLGVEPALIDCEPGNKVSLLASIGPAVEGGYVLSGHIDTVPVDGQAWSVPPFALTQKDGRYYGRGSADMKGYVAVMLAMVPEFIAAKLKRPVHLAISCDEETGCHGVRPLIDHLMAHAPRPSSVFVGEPSLMAVVNGHKSANTFVTEVTGYEAHSSLLDRGVNAIMVAAELLAELRRILADFQARGDPSGRFDPASSTLHVGTIEGGTSRNIVPRHCRFLWEARMLPGGDDLEAMARLDAFAATLIPAMRAMSPDCGITTTRTNLVAGLKPEPQGLAEQLALQCAGSNATHAVSYCTEAGLFQAQGLSTVICGPGSIGEAHRPDEFIAISELAACEAFMRRLIRHAEGP